MSDKHFPARNTPTGPEPDDNAFMARCVCGDWHTIAFWQNAVLDEIEQQIRTREGSASLRRIIEEMRRA